MRMTGRVPSTVKSLVAPSKFKPSQHEFGRAGTCCALLRPVQGVGPVRIQIDPSPRWFTDLYLLTKSINPIQWEPYNFGMGRRL